MEHDSNSTSEDVLNKQPISFAEKRRFYLIALTLICAILITIAATSILLYSRISDQAPQVAQTDTTSSPAISLASSPSPALSSTAPAHGPAPTLTFNPEDTSFGALPQNYGVIKISPLGNNFAYAGGNSALDYHVFSRNLPPLPHATNEVFLSPYGTHVFFRHQEHLYINQESYPNATSVFFSPDEQRKAILIHEQLKKDELPASIKEFYAAYCQGDQECTKAALEAEYEDNKGYYFQEHLIIDGQPTEKFYKVTGVAFSPDSKDILWAANTDKLKDWALYKNAQKVRDLPTRQNGHFTYNFALEKFATELPVEPTISGDACGPIGCPQIRNPSLVVSPDGKQRAWIEVLGNETVVLNSQPQARFGSVLDLVFSPNSQHLMYRAGTFYGPGTAREALIVDGRKLTPDYNQLSFHEFSPDSQLVAYAYQETEDAPEFVAVSDLQGNTIWKSPAHEDIVGTVAFSPDGSHIGYGAVKNNELWWIAEKIR